SNSLLVTMRLLTLATISSTIAAPDGTGGARSAVRRARTPSAARSLPEYWVGPRSGRRGAGCEATRRRPMPAHRGGAATKQTAPRRRNPKGAWGLRPHTASLVVGDRPTS